MCMYTSKHKHTHAGEPGSGRWSLHHCWSRYRLFEVHHTSAQQAGAEKATEQTEQASCTKGSEVHRAFKQAFCVHRQQPARTHSPLPRPSSERRSHAYSMQQIPRTHEATAQRTRRGGQRAPIPWGRVQNICMQRPALGQEAHVLVLPCTVCWSPLPPLKATEGGARPWPCHSNKSTHQRPSLPAVLASVAM